MLLPMTERASALPPVIVGPMTQVSRKSTLPFAAVRLTLRMTVLRSRTYAETSTSWIQLATWLAV